MKILLVPWWLLLFGVSLNSGHYIRDTEYGNPTYKIQEDSSGVTFLNPKPEQPTLREILYYHIIERPREEPAITERSITNGHGYQFSIADALADEYDEKEDLLTENNDELEHEEDENHEYLEKDEDTENEEATETTTEARRLTNEEVKEAYKSRSYLFDQMRQRYAVKRQAVPNSLNRKKRQAEFESIPEAPRLSRGEDTPRTYGMNLNPEGGYVWNNLNKPATYYELGPSNGNPNEGYEPAQTQENMSPPDENAYIPPSETSNSGSSEDIYVNTYRPSAIPLETGSEIGNPEAVDNPEVAYENPVPNYENPEQSNENSGANYPVEPIAVHNDEGSSEGFANNPIGPEVYENPEPSYPVEPIVENPGTIESASNPEPEVPQPEVPVNEYPAESAYGYEQPSEEPKPESSPGESSEGDIINKMPEGPTLPPLNYDNLPDYIRDAISSTEKPASYEQTENPYINPQTNADDKKELEDKMEDMFATMTPVEEIPKTYGMNLTSDGGHVWNDMVNPPVSYDVGSPSQPEEEHKEEQTQTPLTEQPEIHEETDNPIPEPAEPEEEPIAIPEEPIQEPEPNENEEITNPAEPSEPPNEESEEPIANPQEPTPLEPEEEQEPEEPIADPNTEIPEPNNEPELEIPENENNKPMEEPEEPVKPELEEPEQGNEDNHDIELTEKPDDAEEPSEVNGDHLEEQNPAEQNPEEEKEKPDIMSELLKSEQFWKWLGEWTATYMELLEKHIRKIAIQEICNREKTGEQMCLLDDDSGDTGVVIKDGKVIVDGKEIDMTHRNNLDSDSELKRGSHSHKPDNGSNGNKIEASKIYGNSVGNDKVTNVFIFTADKADEVIDTLKPANESEVDFVIDDRIKEEDKEINKEKSIEEIGAEESNTDDIKESNEGELDKEQLSNEEADKSDSNDDDAMKEEKGKEPEQMEESNASETVPEEVIKEEPNKESVENSDSKPEVDEESNVSEAVTEEVIKDEANEESVENSDSKLEKDKDSSGDIEESDDDKY